MVSFLASKTGNVLVNKIANAYRSARGKERVAYSNFRRGVEIPQAPEQTNSQVFENIKNVYDDIGIDTPLPKANIVPYDETFARKQAQNSEFIKGDGFRMQRDNEPPFTDYNVKTEVDEWVKNLSELERSDLEANLYTLYKKHPELYQGPADVYRDLIQIKNNPTYFFKNNRPDISLLSKKLNDGSLGKLGVVKDSGYVGHVSRSSKYQKEMDRLRLSNEKQLEVGAPYPTLPRTDINQAELTAGAKAHSQAVNSNILPPQNLKAPITTDDIFKEAINLHRSGFKFGKDINENINIVLNKIKNDRLNATSAKNAQVPNNGLLPPPKEPMHNPNWYDEFVKNKPANMDMNYLKKYYDVDGFLSDRANVLAKDIRYNNRQIEPSKIVDNQGHGGWEYKKTRQITEPNYNADFQITKADVNAIKNGTATNQTIQKLADDLEASKYLGYGYDNFSKNVDNYLTSLEQRGIKPELVSSLRQKLVNEPELFTPQRIKETEEFIKNNPNLVLKNPNMKGGFITPNLAKDMASSGVGAGIGANLDEENRLRGAMLGGLGGLAGRHMFSQMPNFIKSNNKNIYNIV